MRRNIVISVTTAICLAVVLAGCSGTGSSRYDYYEPEPDFSAEGYSEQEPDYEPDPSEMMPPPPEPSGWRCVYDESWNDDWHDDVVCSNGYESHRPYLLEGDDFVTYDEIMWEAANYEAYLNSQ